MISNLLLALTMTLVVELVVAALWGVRNRMGLLLVALVNVLTNPAVNLLFAAVSNLASFALGQLLMLLI